MPQSQQARVSQLVIGLAAPPVQAQQGKGDWIGTSAASPQAAWEPDPSVATPTTTWHDEGVQTTSSPATISIRRTPAAGRSPMRWIRDSWA